MDNNCKVKQFYLDQIKEVLAQKNISIEESCQKQPRSSIENSNSEETSKKRKVEVVVFKDKNPGFKKVNISKKKLMSPNEVTEDQKMLKAKKLLKEIEWDVTSFGLKGFSLDEKRKLEQERAIRLGAKPRKQKYVNYKVFMEQRKRQKESGEIKMGKKKKKKTVFWKESLSMPTGMTGRFKDGVLELSKQDIESG